MRRILTILAVLGLLLLPAAAQAAWLPIVPCGGEGQTSCTPCSIFEAVKHLFDLVLYGITGPIAAFMIVYAGGMMLLGGGKPALYSQGKTMLTNTLIGVAIILFAWVATNFLVKALIQGGQGDRWYEFSCPASLAAITPIETALTDPGPPPNVPPPKQLEDPKNLGTATVGSTFTKCNRDLPCPGTCPNMQPILGGRSNSKLLEAIMYNESSCLVNPRPSGAGAYGIMQMQPATANLHRDGCEVTDKDGNPVTITAAWLMSAQNTEKIVCVADNFVNSLKGECGNDPLNIAAGYNGGPGACQLSRDCALIESCLGGNMRRWECPWDNIGHTTPNYGYVETRNYAPKVAACAR